MFDAAPNMHFMGVGVIYGRCIPPLGWTAIHVELGSSVIIMGWTQPSSPASRTCSSRARTTIKSSRDHERPSKKEKGPLNGSIVRHLLTDNGDILHPLLCEFLGMGSHEPKQRSCGKEREHAEPLALWNTNHDGVGTSDSSNQIRILFFKA